MLSRRRTLLSALGLALGDWSVASHAAPGTKRVRANVASMEGLAMLKTYAEGVKIM